MNVDRCSCDLDFEVRGWNLALHTLPGNDNIAAEEKRQQEGDASELCIAIEMHQVYPRLPPNRSSTVHLAVRAYALLNDDAKGLKREASSQPEYCNKE